MLDIIVNERSGHYRGKQYLKTVTEYLNAKQIEFNVHVTMAHRHAETLASELCANGSETIVAMGGDGTFHEVLNGLDIDSPTRLGFIAAGRGNDYCHGTGLSDNPIKALECILSGETADTDFITIGDRRCLNVAGSGLDVSVLQRTANKNNKVTYASSLAACLFSFKPFPFTVSSPDFETYSGKAVMVGVCNGKLFGGGMRVSPNSINDDGLLNVIIIEKPSYMPVIFAMPALMKGKHIFKKYAFEHTCKSVSIDTVMPVELDGEIYENLPFNASIECGKLKTFKPIISK